MAIAGARSGIATVVMFCYLRKPNVRIKKAMLFGSCSYATLLILFVTANKLTTSANAILLQFTAPIWVALFSRWFLKERIRKSDWAAIAAVMLGISYILYTTAIPHVSAIEAILIPILEPLLNPIWVFWIKNEVPGHYAFWGGTIVILSIITRGIYQTRKDRFSLHQN